MAKSKRRSRVGPSNPKYASAVKREMGKGGGDEMKPGGTSKLGRTRQEKMHPSHPGAKFVAARGRASGKATPDAAMIGAKKPAMKKADQKKKRGD